MMESVELPNHSLRSNANAHLGKMSYSSRGLLRQPRNSLGYRRKHFAEAARAVSGLLTFCNTGRFHDTTLMLKHISR
jgi:hypothetical protein